MNPEDPPEVWVLERHFYGILSTAELTKAMTNDVADKALTARKVEVAEAIQHSYVDDLGGSEKKTKIQYES